MSERQSLPEQIAAFKKRSLASSPRPVQAIYDRAVTRNRLANGRNLLLATNKDTRVPQGEQERPWLDYVAEDLERMIKGKVVTIIAYAGRISPDEEPHFPGTDVDYKNAKDKAVEALERFGPKNFVIVHEKEKPELALADAKAIYATGGNTLGADVNINGYKNPGGRTIDNARGANTHPLQYLIRQKVADKTPYVGVSAGQMIAAGHTTPHLDAPAFIQVEENMFGEVKLSMPVNGLNLLGNRSLAIHPHYEADRLTNYGDETQYERVKQMLERSEWMTIIGMKDNSALKVQGLKMTLVGDLDAKAYVMTMGPNGYVVTTGVEYGANLSYLLDTDLTVSMADRLRSQSPNQ